MGTLDSPEAQAGIQDYVDYFKAGSTGPADNDEAEPASRRPSWATARLA